MSQSHPTTMPTTMRAVVLKAPFEVVVEDRPVPAIDHPGQVILKVLVSGLCGSDLHWYRGHAKSEGNFILGHEVVGSVVAAGSAVRRFAVNDIVIAPFSLSCGECFHCKRLNTARCLRQLAFGTPTADGGQAEYIKLDMAESSLFKAPEGLPLDLMVLMTDIIPTGYSVARNARTLLDNDIPGTCATCAGAKKDGVCVVVGCGPVGLCAISSACDMFATVYATDIASHRLEAAAKHGAIALPLDELKQRLAQGTEGRGADAVLEVVGHESALITALELVRPFGAVSSCGVHTQSIQLNGATLYGKNARLQFGRCSVPRYFEGALRVLAKNRELFSTFVENKISLEDAPEIRAALSRWQCADCQFYRLFEQNKIAKTVFVME